MGSWVICLCGNRLHTNLFSGAGISLVVPEAWADQGFEGMDADRIIDSLILASGIQIHCPRCSRMLLVNDGDGSRRVRFYSPEESDASELP